jgi:hypothetical protein
MTQAGIAKQYPESTLPFDAIDRLLTQHPFGNSAYITAELHACFKRRLGRIAAHLPAAGELLDQLSQADPNGQYRVIGDTVVRCAVQHAHTQIETGTQYGLPLDECEDILRETSRLMKNGCYGPLGSGLVERLGPEPLGWIWSEERSQDVFTRALKYVVEQNYHGDLCTPDPEELATLRRGAKLLSELLPQLAGSVLRHVHLIAIFPDNGSWAGKASSSEFRISGTVFLSRKMLVNAWLVAEHLLHEALHQQMYDFRQGHTFLRPDFRRRGAPLITSLWNIPDSNRWDVHRAIAAFHVYVHLGFLAMAAEETEGAYTAEYGPKKMIKSRTAVGRAHYLAEQLYEVCWQELGLAGERFVEWYRSVLELLNSDPAPHGAYIHLLLERYLLEVRHLELMVKRKGTFSGLEENLQAVAEDEMKTVRRVLAELDTDVDLSRCEEAMTRVDNETPETQFARGRAAIVEVILGISRDGYTLSEQRVADEIFRNMVERSSQALKPLIAQR